METFNPDAFKSLPKEKRDRIIGAALVTFAAYGYRKASVSDIAKEAGISKAMVFTYFGTKSGLYEYLLKYVMNTTIDTLTREKPRLDAETDYFERHVLIAKIKLELMSVNRAIMDFAMSMFLEQDPEVRPAIDALFQDAQKVRSMFITVGIDSGKFKNPGDVTKMDKLIRWLSDGCMEDWKRSGGQEDVAALFYECFDVLKAYYYKEEYLNDANRD